MKTIQIVISDAVHARLKDEAWRRRITMADMLRAVLDENLPPAVAVEPVAQAQVQARNWGTAKP